MISFIGILLIELKVFGVSLRTPIISFLALEYRLWLKCLPVIIFLVVYLNIFNGNIIHYEKVNILTFIVINFGAWMMFLMSVSKIYSIQVIHIFLKFTPILFLALIFLQGLNLGLWVDYFSDISDDFYPRSSGLSSEPSFFANMIFYFFLLYFAYCHKNLYLYYLVFFVLFVSTLSVTIFIYLMIMAFVLLLFRIKLGSLKITPLFILILVPCLMIALERAVYFIFGFSLSHLTYDITGSWREISVYSSFYGASYFGPFSGGEWDAVLEHGQQYLNENNSPVHWITWPWSFFSMLLCEFGIIPSIIVVYFFGRTLNKIWYENTQLRPALKWFTLSVVIGLYFAPKWCIYYLFSPILFKNITSE
jgi:hypothetical protein